MKLHQVDLPLSFGAVMTFRPGCRLQRGVAQPPEIGLHMADLQDGHLLIYSRNVFDIITQNTRLVTIGTERKFFEKI